MSDEDKDVLPKTITFTGHLVNRIVSTPTYDEPSNGDPLSETVQGTTDYEAYMRLMSDLQEERKARVEIQAERDEYKAIALAFSDVADSWREIAKRQGAILDKYQKRVEYLCSAEVRRDIDALLAKYNGGGNVP